MAFIAFSDFGGAAAIRGAHLARSRAAAAQSAATPAQGADQPDRSPAGRSRHGCRGG